MEKAIPGALVAVRSFGSYAKGALITDAVAIRAILEGGNACHVVVPVLPSGNEPANGEQH